MPRKYALTAAERAKLKKLRKLIAETHWIKGSYQRTIEGKVCWCLVGGVNHVVDPTGPTSFGGGIAIQDPVRLAYDVGYRPTEKWRVETERRRIFAALGLAIRKVTPRTKASGIEHWNDNRLRTREQVLAVIDVAIELPPVATSA